MDMVLFGLRKFDLANKVWPMFNTKIFVVCVFISGLGEATTSIKMYYVFSNVGYPKHAYWGEWVPPNCITHLSCVVVTYHHHLQLMATQWMSTYNSLSVIQERVIKDSYIGCSGFFEVFGRVLKVVLPNVLPVSVASIFRGQQPVLWCSWLGSAAFMAVR